MVVGVGGNLRLSKFQGFLESLFDAVFRKIHEPFADGCFTVDYFFSHCHFLSGPSAINVIGILSLLSQFVLLSPVC